MDQVPIELHSSSSAEPLDVGDEVPDQVDSSEQQEEDAEVDVKQELKKRKIALDIVLPANFSPDTLYMTETDRAKLSDSSLSSLAVAELMKRVYERHRMFCRELKRKKLEGEVQSGKRPPPVKHESYMSRFKKYLTESGKQDFVEELNALQSYFESYEVKKAADNIDTLTISFGKFFGQKWVDVWNDTTPKGSGKFNECGAAYLDWIDNQKDSYNDCQPILQYLKEKYPRQPVPKYKSQK